MGRAARFARSGQGISIVRGEGAGAKISRGTNRGRPLDIAQDSRNGDFVPLGPGAARKPQPSTLEIPAGKLDRPDPGLGEREVADGTFIIGGMGRPRGHKVVDTPSPFMRDPRAQTSPREVADVKDAAGLSFGGVERSEGSLGRTPKFSEKNAGVARKKKERVEMGRLASVARSGISPAQRSSATSLARDGSVRAMRLGAGARRGGDLPGIGMPPNPPVQQARSERGTLPNADVLGTNSGQASPVSNPPSERQWQGRPMQAMDGYAGPATSRPSGNNAATRVVSPDSLAGRFVGGGPVTVDTGYVPQRGASGKASAPTLPGGVEGRFVAGRPASFGPAGRFA